MKKIRKILMLCLTLGTLITYGSVLVSPDVFKLSAGISVFIPVFIGFNLVALFYFLFKRALAALLPLVLLILGFPFLKVTIAFNSSDEEKKELSVLSYNVRWFKEGKNAYGDLVSNFVMKEPPDILCFQEFNGGDNGISTLAQEGGYHLLANQQDNRLAIYSKFPVLDHGMLFEGQRFNNIQFADLLVADDTLRVYNVHLQSMGINTSQLQDSEGIREGYEEAKTKFLDGAAVRARQIDSLMSHLENCTYAVIIAGDFNDVPYSFNHFRIRRSFTNAFEVAGSGFGITYNGRLPFLRIDHQFFSEGIEATGFKTFDNIGPSDHFPILGIYALSD